MGKNYEDMKHVGSSLSTKPVLLSNTDETITSEQQSHQAPVENCNVKRGKLVRTNSTRITDNQVKNIASQKK